MTNGLARVMREAWHVKMFKIGRGWKRQAFAVLQHRCVRKDSGARNSVPKIILRFHTFKPNYCPADYQPASRSPACHQQAASLRYNVARLLGALAKTPWPLPSSRCYDAASRFAGAVHDTLRG
jgi:hypothetical protein